MATVPTFMDASLVLLSSVPPKLSGSPERTDGVCPFSLIFWAHKDWQRYSLLRHVVASATRPAWPAAPPASRLPDVSNAFFLLTFSCKMGNGKVDGPFHSRLFPIKLRTKKKIPETTPFWSPPQQKTEEMVKMWKGADFTLMKINYRVSLLWSGPEDWNSVPPSARFLFMLPSLIEFPFVQIFFFKVLFFVRHVPIRAGLPLFWLPPPRRRETGHMLFKLGAFPGFSIFFSLPRHSGGISLDPFSSDHVYTDFFIRLFVEQAPPSFSQGMNVLPETLCFANFSFVTPLSLEETLRIRS